MYVRWGADYLVKCHTDQYELYGQVGNSAMDHSVWTRPEDSTVSRPAYKVTRDKPGSDLVAETAAALASAAFLLERDIKYSDELVKHSKELYKFAKEYPGKYDKSIKDAHDNYPSTDYKDELVWAAVWLYLATEEEEYLSDARTLYDDANIGQSSEFSWDDKGPGVMTLLTMVTDEEKYKEDLQRYCDDVVYKKPRSPMGMVFISRWGSLRHASNAAFICLTASHLGVGDKENYTQFSVQQLDYILGYTEDGGHSFVVGFGQDPPQRPHHAASSCPPRPKVCDWSAFSKPGPNPNTLTGALVGGPDNAEDIWEDDRANYVTNEVALDYNAGFSGLIAGVIELQVN